MKKTIIYAALASLLLALLTGADPGSRGRPAPVANAYSPRYDTLYTLIGTSPLTTRTAGCWTGTPDDSVKVGIAWAQPSWSSGKEDSCGYYGSAVPDMMLWGGATIPCPTTGATQPRLVLPYTKRADRDIVQALLCVYIDATQKLVMAAGDSLFVYADTNSNCALLDDSIGQARWSAYPSGAPWVTRANCSWNNIKSGTAWSPTLTSRDTGRKQGPYIVRTGATADIHGWVAFDVTQLVDDFNVYSFGFDLKSATITGYTRIRTPDCVTKAGRPFLLLKTFARSRTAGPWPGGAQVAMSIQVDDGKRTAWMAYDSVATEHGIKLTYAIEVNNVFNSAATWVTAADLRTLLAEGHEIQNQAWFTRSICAGITGEETTHGRFNCNGALTIGIPQMSVALAKADSAHMHVDSSAYWLRKWITNNETVNLSWRPLTFSYANGANSDALEDTVAARGYYGARDASGFTYPLMWVSGYPFKIDSGPSIQQLAGDLSGSGVNANTEAATRAAVRAYVMKYRFGGECPNGMMSLYIHNGAADCDVAHLGWIIDELKLQGVYIDTMANLLNYWRRHHHAASADKADQWLVN